MKLRHSFLILIIAFIAFMQTANAQMQDPTALTQEINVNLDEVGDAKMEVIMKMNASQWQTFKSSRSSSNISIMKRDMERQMSMYELEDFKSDLDEANRIYKLSLTARGLATYKGDGKWEVKLDTKNPNVTKISDNCYLITSNLLEGGAVIQQLQKVFFPEDAGEISEGTDAFGKAIFTYKYYAEPSMFDAYNISGSILILASAFIFIRRRGGLEGFKVPLKYVRQKPAGK